MEADKKSEAIQLNSLKQYGLITVLGFVSLEFCYVMVSLWRKVLFSHIRISELLASQPNFNIVYFWNGPMLLLPAIFGTLLLTVGVYGFGKHYFKGSEFVLAFLTPLLSLAPFVIMFFSGVPTF